MVTKVESFDVLLKNAENEFRNRFNYEPSIVTAAPGRVNLIGEHIDYNDGFVLPMVRYPLHSSRQLIITIPPHHSRQALPMVTIMVGGANGSESLANVVTLTENIDEAQKQVSFDVKALSPGSSPKYG